VAAPLAGSTEAPVAASTTGAAKLMSSPADNLVLAEHRGRVLLLTLNRPAKLNAWTADLEDQYFALLAEADDDPQVWAVVVTGAGRGFCSGADLGDLKDAAGASPQEVLRPRPRDFPLSVRKPIIGAINGVAAGLGMVEALYFDVRFGGPHTRFTTAFARRGLIAEYGISWLLPRLIGPSRACDLLLSSRMVDANEAYRIGLLDHLVAEQGVAEAAVEYANDLATHCSAQSMAIIKRQLRRDAAGPYEEAVARADQLMLESFHGRDVIEGVASHLEKRAPNFPALPARGPRVHL
jgi:enoyl-CoA hydratase/carnithine racemase